MLVLVGCFTLSDYDASNSVNNAVSLNYVENPASYQLGSAYLQRLSGSIISQGQAEANGWGSFLLLTERDTPGEEERYILSLVQSLSQQFDRFPKPSGISVFSYSPPLC